MSSFHKFGLTGLGSFAEMEITDRQMFGTKVYAYIHTLMKKKGGWNILIEIIEKYSAHKIQLMRNLLGNNQ